MARAFILGHGSRDPGGEKTFVPEGRSISFYSDVDENTVRWNGLAALNAGDIPPVETFAAESEIYNYRLSRFDDRAIAQHIASESSLTGGTTYFIGLETKFQSTPLPSPLRLCTTPKECAKTKPKHSPSCQGLFALIPDEEILSVSCRGVRGENPRDHITTRLGARKLDQEGHDTSEDFYAENIAEAKRLLALSKTDPAAVIAHIESLSEPTREILFAAEQLRLFVENYYKKAQAAAPQAVLEGRRALEALGEGSFADRVDAYVRDPDPGGAGAKQKQMVLADPELKAAYDRSVEERTQTKLKEKELDLEAIERQKAMREKAQPQIDALQKRRTATAPIGVTAKAEEVIPTTEKGGDKPPSSPPTVSEVSKEKTDDVTVTEAGSKEVDRAVKLLEMSQQKTDDPYYTVAIWRMIEGLADAVRAAAKSTLGW